MRVRSHEGSSASLPSPAGSRHVCSHSSVGCRCVALTSDMRDAGFPAPWMARHKGVGFFLGRLLFAIGIIDIVAPNGGLDAASCAPGGPGPPASLLLVCP